MENVFEKSCDLKYDESFMKLFGCKNAKTYEECISIIPSLGRRCIYENNECKEQFLDCFHIMNMVKDH